MENKFVVLTKDNQNDSIKNESFSNLQDASNYFQRFAFDNEPTVTPVAILNTHTKSILEVSDFYEDKQDELKELSKSYFN